MVLTGRTGGPKQCSPWGICAHLRAVTISADPTTSADVLLGPYSLEAHRCYRGVRDTMHKAGAKPPDDGTTQCRFATLGGGVLSEDITLPSAPGTVCPTARHCSVPPHGVRSPASADMRSFPDREASADENRNQMPVGSRTPESPSISRGLRFQGILPCVLWRRGGGGFRGGKMGVGVQFLCCSNRLLTSVCCTSRAKCRSSGIMNDQAVCHRAGLHTSRYVMIRLGHISQAPPVYPGSHMEHMGPV